VQNRLRARVINCHREQDRKHAKLFAKLQAGLADFFDADSLFTTLKFADGSNGTIAYPAEGDKGRRQGAN
jgi:hypothetical protein